MKAMYIEVYYKESAVIEDDKERAPELVRAEESVQGACWREKQPLKMKRDYPAREWWGLFKRRGHHMQWPRGESMSDTFQKLN